MTKNPIDYQDLVKKALKGVLKDILLLIGENGVVGEQHYYITFKTGEPGVDIPKRLASQYPGEMTIVIQHRFWDLKVEDEHFEIGLSFNQKPEHLIIPYAAVTSIVDPSERFALQFEDPKEKAEEEEALQNETPAEEPPGEDKKSVKNVVSMDAFRKQ